MIKLQWRASSSSSSSCFSIHNHNTLAKSRSSSSSSSTSSTSSTSTSRSSRRSTSRSTSDNSRIVLARQDNSIVSSFNATVQARSSLRRSTLDRSRSKHRELTRCERGWPPPRPSSRELRFESLGSVGLVPRELTEPRATPPEARPRRRCLQGAAADLTVDEAGTAATVVAVAAELAGAGTMAVAGTAVDEAAAEVGGVEAAVAAVAGAARPAHGKLPTRREKAMQIAALARSSHRARRRMRARARPMATAGEARGEDRIGREAGPDKARTGRTTKEARLPTALECRPTRRDLDRSTPGRRGAKRGLRSLARRERTRNEVCTRGQDGIDGPPGRT
mmetsp:Transcript_13303/g.49396  ORF Transcript_13303/g.49396 Transcript_13303/m.49396 type:complete len:335 (-) Transcript_13303:35-1039(-)